MTSTGDCDTIPVGTQMMHVTKNKPFLAKVIYPLLSAAGGIYFLQRTVFFAQRMGSLIDEGAYLLRGYWFASGTYGMYIPYGPVTNHMPLSFLPYGLMQQWFGPGLWQGRLFAVTLAIAGLAGLWVLVRRMWGEGWAALAVWTVALNPSMAEMYSQAVSQVVVFALFTWMLAIGFGRERQPVHVISGAILATLIYFTRINMAPIYPLYMGYVFLRHGKRTGWKALGWSLAVLIILHLIFSPGIFQFEYRIIRKFYYTIFPSQMLPTRDYQSYWSQSASGSELLVVWYVTLRAHFMSMLGACLALVLSLIGFRQIRKRQDAKELGFLFVTYITLLFVHAFYSLSNSYCIYCLPSYSGFFSFLGILLLVFAFQLAGEDSKKWLGAGVVIALNFALQWVSLYHASTDAGRMLQRIYNTLPGFQRINNLLGVAAGRLGLPYSFEGGMTLLLASGMAALTAVILFGMYLAAKRGRFAPHRPIWNAVLITVLFGLLLSPTRLLGGIPNENYCGRKTTASYDAAGRYLAERIPPGSRVIFYTHASAAPVLHLEDVEFFHPTINGNYFRYIGGDSDLINSIGAWNEEIALAWAQRADFILLNDGTALTYGGDDDIGLRLVQASGFELLDQTERVVDCRIYSPIYIYGKPRSPA